ncbi:hypothetical protein [uncultured Roseibium sp.]|uniref:hypothetical protein n=1 Tax=uncultured Roseibium sp. TaxID=1936171 RepID=UPI00374926BB
MTVGGDGLADQGEGSKRIAGGEATEVVAEQRAPAEGGAHGAGELLSNSNDHRLISTIAYTYGYTNQALFSRHFQAEFGFDPPEARAAKLCGSLPRNSAPKSFAEWLGQGRGG